jgi:hypothetical protein
MAQHVDLTPVSNREDWDDTFDLVDVSGDESTALDLSAVTAMTFVMWDPDAPTTSVLSASYAADIATVTMTIATPCVVSWTAHGQSAGQVVRFLTTGALATGITADTDYYIISTGLGTDSFQFSATLGGAAVNTSGTQSGTHTAIATTEDGIAVDDTDGGTISLHFDADDVADAVECAKSYAFRLGMVNGGATKDLMIGAVQFYYGGPEV